MSSSTNKCIITGADATLQDLLPWWIKNVKANINDDVDIVVVDLGLSENAADWAYRIADKVIKFDKHEQCAWFMKPTALLHADYKYKCWIDIDCEVVGDISDIFDNFEEDKIACAPDEFHSWGCRWQTGVFGTVGEPSILGQWAEMSQKATNRGDQEILWDIVKEDEFKYIKELSADYNWLRLSIEKGNENPNAKIIHWTGPAGKKIIRGKWKWSKK